MLKEFVEKIMESARPEVKEIDGRHFVINDGIPFEIKPVPEKEARLELNSLDALVKMVKSEALGNAKDTIFITVPSHVAVECFSKPMADLQMERVEYYRAVATDLPTNAASTQLGFEEAIIALRTRYMPTPDTDYALKLLSEITSGSKLTMNDNGIATTVMTQKGVSLQSNEAIKPIITLKPYRTFFEIDQPPSQFLIRVAERGISFIEADGGMWKLQARKSIYEFLTTALAKEVKDGKVVIAY